MSRYFTIAVESQDHDGRFYRTRYWGDGPDTFLWESEETAIEYMNQIDDGFFHDKTAVISDVCVIPVDREDIDGSVVFPTWNSPDENPRNTDPGGIISTTSEGYDTPMFYEEES